MARDGPAAVYDRVAASYDRCAGLMERMGGQQRRRRLFARATGNVLEVGVGTGMSLGSYPERVHLVGIDVSEQMLRRARERAALAPFDVTLFVADVERLPFADASFDTVTASCVFCSVADPIQGLRELRRVVAPSGRVLLLEHVRPTNPLLGRIADLISPCTRRMFGPEVNRPTEANVEASGLVPVAVRRTGVWREIVARPG